MTYKTRGKKIICDECEQLIKGASIKFKGQDLCPDCLNKDYDPADFHLYGKSNMGCAIAERDADNASTPVRTYAKLINSTS